MLRRSVLAFALIVSTSLYSAQSAASMGTSVGNTANAIFGSKAGINTRVNNPLLGQSKMATIDNSKTFDSTMQCASNDKAVGITFLPVGGNDYRLVIKQDTNLDKAFDYTYDSNVLGRSVSGICNNGIVMCTTPGSWNNCNYYVWDTSDKKIFLRPVAISSSELGGCYCSNSSCGVNSLEAQMYETVGGGVSAAIMAKNTLFIHSKSQWSPSEMTYYLFGQNRTSCTGGVATKWDNYGQKNPTKYYESQVPPNISIADVAVEQGSDQNSYYSMINHQSEVSYDYAGNKIGMPSTTSCTIKHIPFEATKNVYVSKTANANIFAHSSSNGYFYQLDYAGCGNSISTIDRSFVPNGLIRNFTCGYNYKVTYTGPSKSYPHSDTTLPFFVEWEQPTVVNYTDISNTNDCSSIDTTDCTILDEQVCDQSGNNCNYSIKNGIKQNIMIGKKCFTGAFSTSCSNGSEIFSTTNTGTINVLYTGSDAWFYTKRTYSCKAKDISINTDQMQNTLGTVQKNESTSVMTYTDVGGVSRTAQLPTGDTCPSPMCTIKRPATNTSTFSDNTNRSQTAGGTGVYETVIKTCSAPDQISAKTCPIDQSLGEQMVEDCSCTGGQIGFQKAITSLEVVDKAAKDMICSQD